MRIQRVQCKPDNSCRDACDFHITMKRVNLWRRDSNAPRSLVKYSAWLSQGKRPPWLSISLTFKKAVLYRLVNAAAFTLFCFFFLGPSTVNGRLSVWREPLEASLINVLLRVWQDRNVNSIGQSVPCLWTRESTVGGDVSIRQMWWRPWV